MDKKNMEQSQLLILQSRATKLNSKNLKIKIANARKAAII